MGRIRAAGTAWAVAMAGAGEGVAAMLGRPSTGTALRRLPDGKSCSMTIDVAGCDCPRRARIKKSTVPGSSKKFT